jgi:outer membrane protein assembly factor BamB
LPDAPMAPLAANGSGTNAPWAYQMQNMQNTGYSPQTLVNPSNVGSLQLLWATSASGLAGTPVISKGIVYVFGAGKCPCLFAVQESTGRVLWADGKGGTQLTGTFFKTRVGVTIDRGLVFAGDQNNNVLAINAATGALVWNSSLIQGISTSRYAYSGAEATPLVWNGRIFIGVVFGDNGVRGFVRAFNETDGSLLWTFYTTPPEPITDSNQLGYQLGGQNTWGTGGNNSCSCGGGSVWNVPALDPSTGTIYFGTGNPWPNGNKTVRAPNSSDLNLYTDSVVALDAATGQMKWYFQEVPGYYNGDLDVGVPVQVFNTTIDGVQTKVVGSGGKAGYYYELNAQTGAEIFKVPLGIHINENETAAGVSWRAQVNTLSTYDPLTNMVYAQADNHGSNCNLKSGVLTCKEFTTAATANSTLYAIDASTGKRVWNFDVTDGYGGGVSSTNSLVFTSDADQHFYAFNGFTGGLPLWNYTDTGGGTKNFWSWGPPSITDGMVFETTFGNATAGALEAYIPSASQAGKVQVSIGSRAYSPNPVVVVIGVNNSVTWVNYDSVAHTVTASGGSFDSGPIGPSNWYSYTFTSVGTYNYSSTLQPGMTGTVIVKAQSTTTSSSSTTTSSSSRTTGFVFTVRVTQKGVPYPSASVFVTEGSLTVASGLTDSNGTFRAALPQGTYSVLACETGQCLTSVSGNFPPNAQGGSISLDFSTSILTTTTSSSASSVSQTSSVTSGSSATSQTSTTSSSTGGSPPTSTNLYLYASIGVVALGVAVGVVALWLRRRS